MTADDVKTALDTLEAADAKQPGRVRKALEASVTFAQDKSGRVREAADKALAAAESRGLTSVKDGAALGRVVYDMVQDDARHALDCMGRIAKARSVSDVVRAQLDYVRVQTDVNVQRWRSVYGVVAKAAGAATNVVEERLHGKNVAA